MTPDCDPEDDLDASVLSLGLFPGEYLDRQICGEDRTMFRFEAAWDSSLHNSLLLNRVTPAGETVYMTISAYLELESAFSPAIVTKDLAMMVYGRGDGRIGPRIKHLFQGTFRDGAQRNFDCAATPPIVRQASSSSQILPPVIQSENASAEIGTKCDNDGRSDKNFSDCLSTFLSIQLQGLGGR